MRCENHLKQLAIYDLPIWITFRSIGASITNLRDFEEVVRGQPVVSIVIIHLFRTHNFLKN